MLREIDNVKTASRRLFTPLRNTPMPPARIMEIVYFHPRLLSQVLIMLLDSRVLSDAASGAPQVARKWDA